MGRAMVGIGRNRTGDRSNASGQLPDARSSAFALLYDELFESVYRFCRIRIADPADAEDMAAAIFARAFAAYPPAKAESTRSWLFAIAHNMVANHYRSRGHRQRRETLDEAIEIADPGLLPEQSIIAADERQSLHRALGALTGDQRRVIELRLTGLTGPEIAAALGRSHAAVKMLQLRAIERLRQTLDPTPSICIMKEEEGHARR
jgi:RNA polymerase sigma-70 factor (ECF subfamily)